MLFFSNLNFLGVLMYCFFRPHTCLAPGQGVKRVGWGRVMGRGDVLNLVKIWSIHFSFTADLKWRHGEGFTLILHREQQLKVNLLENKFK